VGAATNKHCAASATMTTRISLQPCYVLHGRPYRDSSLLLEVFTADYGRLSLVARGARRSSRGGSAAALLQPFRPLLLSFSGRSELKTLTGSEAAGAPLGLRGERLFSGLYLNELVVRLLHRHDPHPALFAMYGATLAGLDAGGAIDGLLRRFELTLLEELGYRLELAADGASGAPVSAAGWYRYDPGCGLVELAVAEAPPEGAYAGNELLAMADGDFDGAVRYAARRLLREVIGDHLGGVPLRSRDLFPSSAGRDA